MKKFKQYITELNLKNEPADYANVEDNRDKKPIFKAGDNWSSSMQRMGKGKTVTQKEADDINSGKVNGGSPFPNSWAKKTSVAKAPVPKRSETKPDIKQASTKSNDEMTQAERVRAWDKAHSNKASAPSTPKPKSTAEVDKPYNQAETDKRQSDILAKAEKTYADNKERLTSVKPNNPLGPLKKGEKANAPSNVELDNMFKEDFNVMKVVKSLNKMR